MHFEKTSPQLPKGDFKDLKNKDVLVFSLL